MCQKILASIFLFHVLADANNCPDAWFDGGHLGCYKFLEDRLGLTWAEAQLACEMEGGYLAEPKTAEHIDFVSELIMLVADFSGVKNWYIGLSDLGKEGDWKWIHSDEDITESIWDTNRPNNSIRNGDDCVFMKMKRNKAVWVDDSCVSTRFERKSGVGPLCQTEGGSSIPSTTTTLEPTTTPRPTNCPDNWKEFDGDCYILYRTVVNWYEAAEICLGVEATLTSVHSRREEDFLNHIIYYNVPYLLGGMISGNGDLIWRGDGSEVDYEHYSKTGVNPGECLYQNVSDIGQGWRSTSCRSSQ